MLELDWTNTNPDIHVTQQVANFRCSFIKYFVLHGEFELIQIDQLMFHASGIDYELIQVTSNRSYQCKLHMYLYEYFLVFCLDCIIVP